jgi:hypothetical protein
LSRVSTYRMEGTPTLATSWGDFASGKRPAAVAEAAAAGASHDHGPPGGSQQQGLLQRVLASRLGMQGQGPLQRWAGTQLCLQGGGRLAQGATGTVSQMLHDLYMEGSCSRIPRPAPGQMHVHMLYCLLLPAFQATGHACDGVAWQSCDNMHLHVTPVQLPCVSTLHRRSHDASLHHCYGSAWHPGKCIHALLPRHLVRPPPAGTRAAT